MTNEKVIKTVSLITGFKEEKIDLIEYVESGGEIIRIDFIVNGNLCLLGNIKQNKVKFTEEPKRENIEVGRKDIENPESVENYPAKVLAEIYGESNLDYVFKNGKLNKIIVNFED